MLEKYIPYANKYDKDSKRKGKLLDMKTFFLRILRLIFGLFLYGFAIVVTINAQIGYAPWDVLSAGLAESIDISIGLSSIVQGVVFIFIAHLLGEKIGIGTLFNTVLIGVFMDMVLEMKIVPVQTNFFIGLLQLIVGLVIISFATYFYIGTGFGAGPRDSLMVAFSRKSSLSLGLCRSLLEIAAAVAGWFLGGMLGVGTLISATAVGPIMDFIFKIIKFDPKKVTHETIADTFNRIK